MFGVLEFNKLNRKIEHHGAANLKINSIKLNNISDIELNQCDNIMRIFFYANNMPIQIASIDAQNIKEIYMEDKLFYSNKS